MVIDKKERSNRGGAGEIGEFLSTDKELGDNTKINLETLKLASRRGPAPKAVRETYFSGGLCLHID
jgi:hypothetical protein